MRWNEYLIKYFAKANLSKKVTKTELAAAINVSLPHYLKLEDGGRKPSSVEMVEILADKLLLSTIEKKEFYESALRDMKTFKILDFEKRLRAITHPDESDNPNETFQLPADPAQQIPVIDWVNASQFKNINDPFLPGTADEWIWTTEKGKNLFALKVQNDCMAPEFLEGDIIVVKPNVSTENNDFIIVADRKENKATFKQYKVYGSQVILHPLNPKYNDIILDHDERYEIVGKIVQKIKKYL